MWEPLADGAITYNEENEETSAHDSVEREPQSDLGISEKYKERCTSHKRCKHTLAHIRLQMEDGQAASEQLLVAVQSMGAILCRGYIPKYTESWL